MKPLSAITHTHSATLQEHAHIRGRHENKHVAQSEAWRKVWAPDNGVMAQNPLPVLRKLPISKAQVTGPQACPGSPIADFCPISDFHCFRMLMTGARLDASTHASACWAAQHAGLQPT